MMLGYLAFSAIYLGSAAAALAPPRLLQPTAVDALIPLIDWTVWVYFTQFMLLPAAIVYARDDADRSRTFYAMLAATAIAALVFMIWPTQIERQTQSSAGLTGLAWSVLYLVDTPLNCFPSLHVALAAIAGASLWRRGSRLPALTWPALIAISTLSTKQHIAWDIAGGFVLAALAWILTRSLIRHERPQPTRHAARA